MRALIFIFISTLFFSCNNKGYEHTNSQQKPVNKASKIELDIEEQFVIARSGLNYRKEIKGSVIGKFDYGKKVAVVGHSGIFETIMDENTPIEGEWLVVQVEDELFYAFGGYLYDKEAFEIRSNDVLNLIPPDHEIEYRTEGDLNGDRLNDLVVVTKRKENFEGAREVMIFLKDKTGYILDKTSKTIFPNKFYANNIESYYQEEISITENQLSIYLYGTGPVGNNFSTLKYFGSKLLITHIETFNMGAGGQSTLNYDLLKGILVSDETNTMDEDMPTETTTLRLPIREFTFEKASPEDIIISAYSSL